MAQPTTQRGAPATTVSERFVALAKTAQFYWWVGHVVVLVFGTLYYLKRPFGSQAANWYYTKAYLGALMSYTIVIYKTYGPPQANLAFVHRLIVDENVEYLFLAGVWLISKPMVVTLVPFVVFSLFHVVSYTRSSLIPVFAPGVAAEVQRARQAQGEVRLSLAARVSKAMGDWSTKYHIPAMREVAVWEVGVIGVWTVLGAVTFQTSLLLPPVYFQILRLRYALNSATRAAFYRLRALLDRHLTPPTAHQNVPGFVADVYIAGRDFLVGIGNAIMDPSAQQQQQPQQPQQRQRQR
ncbi:Transmembrane nucleoporin [Coemansia spiralis]|nr:Transmembrane nucleoporin [Coemansia spiralis]